MQYEITISGEQCEKIEFKADDMSQVFQSLQFWIDTVEENANDRSTNIRNKVELKMKIDESTNRQCKQMMDWSLLSRDVDVHRKVQIDILDENGALIRSFVLEEMFVDDYMETYGEGGGPGGEKGAFFTLKLIQKAGKRERFRQDVKRLTVE